MQEFIQFYKDTLSKLKVGGVRGMNIIKQS